MSFLLKTIFHSIFTHLKDFMLQLNVKKDINVIWEYQNKVNRFQSEIEVDRKLQQKHNQPWGYCRQDVRTSSVISMILFLSPMAWVLVSWSISTSNILGATAWADFSPALHIDNRILDVGWISLSSGSHRWCLHSARLYNIKKLSPNTKILYSTRNKMKTLSSLTRKYQIDTSIQNGFISWHNFKCTL